MPSTIDIDFDHNLLTISGRTDASGDDEAVHDVNAGDVRLVASAFTQGAVTEDAFVLTPDSGMDLTLGSGTVGHDVYVVEGPRWNYFVSVESAGVQITVPASDAQSRVDEVYLVVLHDQFDSSGLALARIGYRRGDAGGGSPGPDSGWDAAVLLHTINVPGAATEILAENLTDEREAADLSGPLKSQVLAAVLPLSGGSLSGTLTGPRFDATTEARIGSNPPTTSSYHLRIGQVTSVKNGVLIEATSGAGRVLFGFRDGDGPIGTVLSDAGDLNVSMSGARKLRYNGAEVATVASGTYTGNGTSSRTISVGFRARHIRIAFSDLGGQPRWTEAFWNGETGSSSQRHLATFEDGSLSGWLNANFNSLITATGFIVGVNGNGIGGWTNLNGFSYWWVAIG